jgi:chemotaxis protein methyltransferase CheR
MLVSDRSGDEITKFLDVISTNVTSFFREVEHFEFLGGKLAEWIRQGKKKLRIWSAASSTGEEPYSIVMTVLAASIEKKFDFRLLATDISTRALVEASNGCYPESIMTGVPDSFRKRFFSKSNRDNGLFYEVRETLKNHIVFRRLNLSKPPFPMKGQLDVVFCRNVMIYFNDETRSRLLSEIYRLLNPEGYLITGHAESLASIKTPFKCVKPSIYMKQSNN